MPQREKTLRPESCGGITADFYTSAVDRFLLVFLSGGRSVPDRKGFGKLVEGDKRAEIQGVRFNIRAFLPWVPDMNGPPSLEKRGLQEQLLLRVWPAPPAR